MADAPILSVVLPNFNHATLLPRAVGALLAQETRPDEILIIDDGSTDDSRFVIERMAADVPSIRVLFNGTNKGAVPTLARGLDAATGRYVYLAAADDWVMPGFFRIALDMLQAHPDAGLFCGEAVLVDGRTNRPTSVRPAVRPVHHTSFIRPAQAARLLKRIDNWILTGSTVFQRDCVMRSGGLDERLGAFADGFLARKIALTYGFVYVPRVVACWAVFPDSYSRKTASNIDQARQALSLIPQRLAADSAFPKWYPSVFERRWRFATSRLALEAEPVDYSLVAAMGAPAPLDRMVMRAARQLLGRRSARLVTLAWLWLRLRPTSLIGLARTALAGRMIQFKDRTVVAAEGGHRARTWDWKSE